MPGRNPAHEVRQPGTNPEDTRILLHKSRDAVANVFKRIFCFLQEPQRLVSPTALIFAAANSLSPAVKPAIRRLLPHDCKVEYDRGDHSTTNWPPSRIPTTDGVNTSPWALGISFGAPSAKIAQSEFVVPRSIPTIVPM